MSRLVTDEHSNRLSLPNDQWDMRKLTQLELQCRVSREQDTIQDGAEGIVQPAAVRI